ncbi:sensor histidine kinase [Streptomyces sp. TRM 70361]|uniref:sensor histidine kinase n=1 Tax=Streptomyces sp. TRM 70361 TaxID=3116553 RepID=UPI002E7B146E|nr:sensor histidine kinase [Streptomyces sp. TRM 70361]MEE1939793.1 sensor histidine kinase [Streptomyces sp. TRM 70361]
MNHTGLERCATRFERYADRHPRVVDVLLVLTVTGCAILGDNLSWHDAGSPDHDQAAAALLGVSCLALLRYRSRPRTAVVVTAVCAVAAAALGYQFTPLLLAPLIAALYWLATLTELTDRRTTRVYGVLVIVAALVAASAVAGPADGHSLVLRAVSYLFWLLLPLAAGNMTRLRRAYLASVQARAEHAERTREEEARLRVTEERMRIARELHDVVAHHLALANAQAGTAAHLVLTDPPKTKEILTDLTGTTSSALRELKATLGLLRQNDGPAAAPLEPSPGLARLPELVSACASAGLAVTVTTTGEPRPLSPGADLTAFRIVQEALTNVTKHAAADSAHVHLAYSGPRLLITVSNDGPDAAGTTGAAAAAGDGPVRGFGIMGMRERAHTAGGELRAGPRPEGGFEVTTALPLQPSEPGAAGHATDAPEGGAQPWPSRYCSPMTRPYYGPLSGS